MKLTKSINSFTGNIIDYAGLFPPAKLNLQDALANYHKYRTGQFEFMLSKFICPVKLFPELSSIIKVNYPDKILNVSALGSGGNNIQEFKTNLDSDLILWNDLLKTNDKVNIDSLEVRLPDEILATNDSKKIAELIDYLSDNITEGVSGNVFIFLEGSPGINWKQNYRQLINAVEIHNLKLFNSGFKLRTGGVEATSFPGTDQIAFCIRESLDRKVPIKFTAGLHHPFRHFDKEIGTMMHGFINVFGSGIIAMRHDISNDDIEKILNDENSSDFIFTDEYFSWKGWKIDIADIDYARQNLVLSFGSCSFDEPVDDLISLNLL